ncbi:MAG: hypothetical protein WAV38_09750 [Xanthobacteraceae bacterium]
MNFITAPHAHDWPKNRRRIAKGSSWLSLNESVPTGHGFQVDGVSLFAASISVGIGRCVSSGAGSVKPSGASRMAREAKAPQPIANLRRVNIMKIGCQLGAAYHPVY